MSVKRKYSKAKANGNHVVWTEKEVLPVPYSLAGTAYDRAEWGVFRVTGRPMYCSGYRLDFQVPASDINVVCRVGLYTGSDQLVPYSELTLRGISMGGDKRIVPNLVMPVESVWKFKMFLESNDDSVEFFPQGTTVTYWLRYAQGPVANRLASSRLSEQGLGFEILGSTFILEE